MKEYNDFSRPINRKVICIDCHVIGYYYKELCYLYSSLHTCIPPIGFKKLISYSKRILDKYESKDEETMKISTIVSKEEKKKETNQESKELG